MKARSGTGAVFAFGLSLWLALAARAEVLLPLPHSLDPGTGQSLDAEQREAARALARAIAALEAGDLEAAEIALEAASRATAIADYVELEQARLWVGRGEWLEAADLAAEAYDAHPDSPLRAALASLTGDARAASGDEAAARVAWAAALDGEQDPATRRALKLAIVQSRQRSGLLPIDADPEQLLVSEFPDDVLPGELPAGQRSAEMALLAAADLVARGRGAEAIEAYREAIGLGLDDAALRGARLDLGLTLFRLRRYDEALATFELLGDQVDARFWRARTLARLGRIDESIIAFEELAGGENGEFSARSSYLVATLLEGRGEHDRAIAHYVRVVSEAANPDYALDALWRIGWSAWMRGDDAEARRRFSELSNRIGDGSEALRPRYWAARAAARAGDAATARGEYEAIARGWPLSYYGWRAQQRLGRIELTALAPASASPEVGASAPASSSTPPPVMSDVELLRVALLLEAGLMEAARIEMAPIAQRAVTRADRERVGRLLVASGDYYRAQQLIAIAYEEPLSRGVRPGDETLLWLTWPPAFREIVEQSAQSLGRVDPALVWAIMREESTFQPEVMSSAGAIGLLQLMPDTARRQARRSGVSPIEQDDQLFEPETNIALGSAYLDYLAGRFPDRMSATIGSYNAGPTAVSRWLRGDAAQWDDDVWVEDIPYDQTRSYVKRVLRSLHVYRSFY